MVHLGQKRAYLFFLYVQIANGAGEIEKSERAANKSMAGAAAYLLNILGALNRSTINRCSISLNAEDITGNRDKIKSHADVKSWAF